MSHGQLALYLPPKHPAGQTGLVVQRTGLTLTPAPRVLGRNLSQPLALLSLPPFGLTPSPRTDVPILAILPRATPTREEEPLIYVKWRPCFTGGWVHKIKVRALNSASSLPLPVFRVVRAGDGLVLAHPLTCIPCTRLVSWTWDAGAGRCVLWAGRLAEWAWGWPHSPGLLRQEGGSPACTGSDRPPQRESSDVDGTHPTFTSEGTEVSTTPTPLSNPSCWLI